MHPPLSHDDCVVCARFQDFIELLAQRAFKAYNNTYIAIINNDINVGNNNNKKYIVA